MLNLQPNLDRHQGPGNSARESILRRRIALYQHELRSTFDAEFAAIYEHELSVAQRELLDLLQPEKAESLQWFFPRKEH